jgi:hypothetical protein
MLIFAGEGFVDESRVYYNDIWELSLSGIPEWTRLLPAGPAPEPASGRAATYDPVRERLLIFGGAIVGATYTDVWELSLSGELAWAKLTTEGTTPDPLPPTAVVYDPVGDRVIMIVGEFGLPGETSAWELALGEAPPVWTQVPTVGAAPEGGHHYHSAVYDPVRQRIVVIGGWRDIGFAGFLGPWSLSLDETPTWTEMAPTGDPPPWRAAHTAIYDPVRDRVVMFGGYNLEFDYQDVWALQFVGDSSEWIELTPAGGPEGGVDGHVAIHDPLRDRMIVHGQSSVMESDLWALNLSDPVTWQDDLSPRVRRSAASAYDAARDAVLMFGGLTGTSPRVDIWSLGLGGGESAGWTELQPSGTSAPQERWESAGDYDLSRDALVVFGGTNGSGYLNDSWALLLGETTGPTWLELMPMGTPPPARSGHTATWDAPRDRLVIFGGTDGAVSFNDAWDLQLGGPTGPTWLPLSPSGSPPPPRAGHTAVHVPAMDAILVFGGFGGGTTHFNDAWLMTFGGSQGPGWSQLLPSGSPPAPREAHTAVYDQVRDRVVIRGGKDLSQVYNDTWELLLDPSGGPVWQELTPAGADWGRRHGQAAIYDPIRDRAVFLGGEDDSSRSYNDAWALLWGGVVAVPPTKTPPSVRVSGFAPNPTHGGAWLHLELPAPAEVQVQIFSLQGRLITSLPHRFHPAGMSRVFWDGTDSTGAPAAAGVYFSRVTIGGASFVRRVALIP